MTIIDAAHAVRVLEAFIEQGITRLAIGKSDAYLEALVEVAKGVVERLGYAQKYYANAQSSNYLFAMNDVIVLTAQAYALRMAQAGMEVPE